MSGRRRLCDGCVEIFEKICDAGCCCCVSCICCTAVVSEAVGSGDTTGASRVQAPPRASRVRNHSVVKCPTAMLSRNNRELFKGLNDIFKGICQFRKQSKRDREAIRGDTEIHDMDKEELQKYVDLLVEEVSENIALFQAYTGFVRGLFEGNLHDLVKCLEALKLGAKLQKLCDWEKEAFKDLDEALEPGNDDVIPEIEIRSDYEKLLQQRRQSSQGITKGSVVGKRHDVEEDYGRVIFVETRKNGANDILVATYDKSIIHGVDFQHEVVPEKYFPYANLGKYLKSSPKTYELKEAKGWLMSLQSKVMGLLHGTDHPSGRAPEYSGQRRLVAGADKIGPITSSAIAMGGIMLLGYIAYRVVRRWRAKPSTTVTTEEHDEPRPRHTVEFL